MKRVIVLLLGMTVILPAVALGGRLNSEVIEAMGKGAEAKIVLKVCDDAGAPVSNASVRVEFDLLPDPHSFYGKTDSKGIVVVRGKTNGNKISFFVGKDGYYGTRSERSFVPMGAERDVKAGKWQPYPFEDTVVLKLIRAPIPLVSRHGIYYFPALKKWTAFDLVANDWVKPHGKGVVGDVEMLIDFEGDDPVRSEHQYFKIRFLNNMLNGAYLSPSSDAASECPFLYSANKNNEFRREFLDENECTWRKFGMLDRTMDMVFRIRSITDPNGSLVSCYYGRLKQLDYGIERLGVGSIVMSWQCNPTPNDTNLEDIEVAKRSREFVRQCEPPPMNKRKFKLWPW